MRTVGIHGVKGNSFNEEDMRKEIKSLKTANTKLLKQNEALKAELESKNMVTQTAKKVQQD